MKASFESRAALSLSVAALSVVCLLGANQGPPPIVDEVRARAFTLVDEKGEVLGEWRSSERFRSLFEMRDSDQKLRLALAIHRKDERTNDIPYISVSDGTPDGAFTMFGKGEDGTYALQIADRSGSVTTQSPPKKTTAKAKKR